MPLVKDKGVHFNPGAFEVEGRVVSGASLFVVKDKGNLRHDAMSYLMSNEYREQNGLGQVNYVTRPDLGTATTEAMFVDAREKNGAGRRWITPHCPMPNVNEAYSTLQLSFSYLYRGRGAEPSKDDWKSGVYTSIIGHFRVDDKKKAMTKRTSRDVPDFIKLFIENTNTQAPLVDVGRLLEYIPDAEPVQDENVAESPPAMDEDDNGPKTSPDIEDVDATDDAEGEEAELESSPDIGVKPKPENA